MSDTYKCSGVAVQRCSVIFYGGMSVFPRKIVYLYSENEKFIEYVRTIGRTHAAALA